MIYYIKMMYQLSLVHKLRRSFKIIKVGHMTTVMTCQFRVIHHLLYSTRRGLSSKEKTKCLASHIQKLQMGSQNIKKLVT